MVYFLPEEFGQSDCLLPVSSDKLREMEHRFEEMDGGQDETDPVFKSIFNMSWKRMIYFIQQPSLKQGLFLRNLQSLLRVKKDSFFSISIKLGLSHMLQRKADFQQYAVG